MLFKERHIEQIRSGSKTVTRREWSDGHGRPRVGSIHMAATELFTSHDEADCYIRILDVYDEALGEMTDEDAQKEGDYSSVESFRSGYEDVYGEGAWDDEKVVTVVEFEYAGRSKHDIRYSPAIATIRGL